MRYCRPGNQNVSVGVWANLQFALILLIIVQARSVAGQDPAISEGPNALANQAEVNLSAALSPLSFDEILIEEAREGHATLRWNDLSEASTYRVSDAAGRVLYSGAFPQAFVSGLEDGRHLFTVAAIDAAGHAIAISPMPAVVEVRHWPLAQALMLFAVGAVVFVALVGVLVYGATHSRSAEDRVTHRSGESQS